MALFCAPYWLTIAGNGEHVPFVYLLVLQSSHSYGNVQRPSDLTGLL